MRFKDVPSNRAGDERILGTRLLAVPAWYDPKARKIVFDGSTFILGVLAIDDEKVAFATEAGVVFSGPLAELTTKWSRFAGVTRYGEMRLNGQHYRLYFSMPAEDAPVPSKNQLTAISDVITEPFTQIGGIFWSSADIVGSLLALPGAVMDAVQGNRNANAVRQWLDNRAR